MTNDIEKEIDLLREQYGQILQIRKELIANHSGKDAKSFIPNAMIIAELVVPFGKAAIATRSVFNRELQEKNFIIEEKDKELSKLKVELKEIATWKNAIEQAFEKVSIHPQTPTLDDADMEVTEIHKPVRQKYDEKELLKDALKHNSTNRVEIQKIIMNLHSEPDSYISLYEAGKLIDKYLVKTKDKRYVLDE